jgi:hypothetical protein
MIRTPSSSGRRRRLVPQAFATFVLVGALATLVGLLTTGASVAARDIEGRSFARMPASRCHEVFRGRAAGMTHAAAIDTMCVAPGRPPFATSPHGQIRGDAVGNTSTSTRDGARYARLE